MRWVFLIIGGLVASSFSDALAGRDFRAEPLQLQKTAPKFMSSIRPTISRWIIQAAMFPRAPVSVPTL